MKYKRKRSIRVLSIILLIALLIGLPNLDGFKSGYGTGPTRVYANTEELKKKQKEEEQKKKEADAEAEKAKDSAEEIEEDIANTSYELNTLLKKQKKLTTDISDKQDEIDQCEKDLEAAQAEVDKQYESMKLRIQFMYENSPSSSILEAILESDGFADMLNRLEYVTDIYRADRELMTAYKDSVDQVVALSEKLDGDMDDLVALQDEYEKQEGEYKRIIAKLEDKKSQYEEQMALYEKQSKEHQKKADEYAEKVRKAEADAANQDGDSYDGGGSGDGKVSEDVDYLNDPSYDPEPTTGVSGKAVVAYALQFVGNPYVWGGNSLTKGCDCSGFVHLVYKHFKISTPRYSQAFKSQGKPVAFVNIKAGDVVVYPGHVAIYIGNGNIVEAQSTKAGITKNRSVKCHTITGLRRYV